MKKEMKQVCDFLDENSSFAGDYSLIKDKIVVQNVYKKKKSWKKRAFWGISSFVLVWSVIIVIPIATAVNYHNKAISFKNTATFQTLNKVKYPEVNYSPAITDVNKEVVDAIQDFALETSKRLFTENKNYIYSPLNLYLLLAMLNEGTSTVEATNELNRLLGIRLPQARSSLQAIYENNYFSGSDGTLKLANSFWFNSQETIQSSFLDILANNYYAEVYKTTFNDEGKNNISKWIKYYTDGMAKLDPNALRVDETTICLLISTLFFDGQWANKFEKSKSYNDTFYSNNGEETVNYMKHEVGTYYYEDEDMGFKSVKDRFKNNISINYILPDEDSGVEELLGNISAKDIFDNENSEIWVNATISVPKFKYENEFFLNEVLGSLGVDKIFIPGNLEGIHNGKNQNSLFIEGLMQKSGIEFSEEGVKAFSFSWGWGAGNVAPGDKIEFKLNRPFMYLIKDYTGIPLFIGIVNNPLL